MRNITGMNEAKPETSLFDIKQTHTATFGFLEIILRKNKKLRRNIICRGELETRQHRINVSQRI